jgi:hypothetical protein
MKTIETIKASILRIPLFNKKSRSTVSKMVKLIPHIKGRPNNKFRPIAIPIISARSQAIIAVCARPKSGMFTHFG